MIKIYGHPMSTCTRKVLTTLVENEIPYELEVVDIMQGAHKHQPHMSRQPFGQIPTMDDSGFKLYESRAIARYLDEQHGGKLVPKEPQARALMEQWISIETSNVSAHLMKFIYEHIFHRKQDEAVLANAAAKLDEAFAIMDAHLATHKHLAGEQFSIADIAFMPYFQYAQATPVKDQIAKYPHVAAWWNRVSERPSWKKVSA